MMNKLCRLQKKVRIEPRQATRGHDSSRSPASGDGFRFLNLPPEIRNYVYEFAVARDSVRRLRFFSLPAISRASRQLRQESLPRYFALNTFVAEVRTSFIGISKCQSHGTKSEYIDPKDRGYKHMGSLDLSRNVTSLLAGCHPRSVIIRNIDFCMLPPDRQLVEYARYRYAILSVRHGSPQGTSMHVNDGPNKEYTRNLIHILEQGKRLLDSMVNEAGYNGLLMLQLRDLAATFRAERMEQLPQHNIEVKAEVMEPVAEPSKRAGDEDEFGMADPEAYFSDSVQAAVNPPTANVNKHVLLSAGRMDVVEDEFDLAEAESYFD